MIARGRATTNLERGHVGKVCDRLGHMRYALRMHDVSSSLVYGYPLPALVDVSDARQVSPLIPGSLALEALPAGAARDATMLAPPGTLERRHDLALMLTAMAPGAPFTVLAPKDMGGSRLAGDLDRLGCAIEESAKRHHRICRGLRPDALDALADAITEGAPRRLDDLGLWSQPGIFSWNRIDPGSALLLDALPALSGAGADFGCGIGVLAHGVLASPAVSRLHLLDIDRRAVDAARRNVDEARVTLAWADVRAGTGLVNLDFVVMNPPFHDTGHEDKGLGQIFIRRAAEALRTGGRLFLVANRHLPYEAVLKPLFRRVSLQAEADGFKVFEAQK